MLNKHFPTFIDGERLRQVYYYILVLSHIIRTEIPQKYWQQNSIKFTCQPKRQTDQTTDTQTLVFVPTGMTWRCNETHRTRHRHLAKWPDLWVWHLMHSIMQCHYLSLYFITAVVSWPIASQRFKFIVPQRTIVITNALRVPVLSFIY